MSRERLETLRRSVFPTNPALADAREVLDWACEQIDAMSTEEKAIKEVIVAARKIQDFLWTGINIGAGFEEFRRMLRKRLVKMDEIKFTNPYWKIEARKRLLQLAAISVQAIGRLENPGFQGTNLGEYADPVKDEGKSPT